MKEEVKKLILIGFVLLFAGIAPNLFPTAQAGYAKLSTLTTQLLIPSIILVAVAILFAHFAGYKVIRRQILVGILAGLAGTTGLEVIREIGFSMGWMPGALPKLLGVLILDRFAMGPSFWSNVAGWSYHFWNGAAFGVIFSLLFGKSKIHWAILYGVLIGVGFMISPATKALGIGIFGLQFKGGYQFLSTVTLAHAAFGAVMGWVINKTHCSAPNILNRLKAAFKS